MVHKDWNRRESTRIRVVPDYPEVFDTIIIGAGPAGMTAAVYSARRKLQTLFITGRVGGQLRWNSDIRNWTGIIHSNGPLLVEQMMSHVKAYRFDRGEFDLFLRENEKAETIKQLPNGLFEVTMCKTGNVFLAKTVQLTVGKRPRLLGIPGEDIARKGRGLSFSATSDAPLYRGKKMVIIGGGNSAMDVALQLVKLTDTITIMTNMSELRGETIMLQRVINDPRITVLYDCHAQEICMTENNNWVRGVRFTDSKGIEQTLPCGGIFEQVGQIPSTEWLGDFVAKDARGHIEVTRDGETSVPGVYAGGDCTNNKFKQVVIAAGQGAVCALQAHEFLLNAEKAEKA